MSEYTSYPDTVSPQIKEGLADLRYQVGSLGDYKKLMKSVAQGNLPIIQKESKVWFTNGHGKKQFDKRRYNERNKAYFHYSHGGKFNSKALSHPFWAQHIMPADNSYPDCSWNPMLKKPPLQKTQQFDSPLEYLKYLRTFKSLSNEEFSKQAEKARETINNLKRKELI